MASTESIVHRNHSVELIVNEYLSKRLKNHDFNGWSSNGTSESNGNGENGEQSTSSLSPESLEKIQSSLESLTNELLSVQGTSIKELTSTMNGSLPPTSFIDYSSFEKVSRQLFQSDIRWSHILTLLVFASELANERTTASNGSNGTESKESDAVDGQVPDVVDGSKSVDFITHISDWLIRYLSTPTIVNWINDHDGWMGIVKYEEGRNANNEEGKNENSTNDKKDGSDDDNSLNGLRSAINLATKDSIV